MLFGIEGSDRRMTYLAQYLENDGHSITDCDSADIVIYPPAFKTDKKYNRVIDNYTQNDLFKQKNAYPTAEGALCIALSNTDKVLSDCVCVITGNGFVSKALENLLLKLDVKTYVCARRNARYGFCDIPSFNPDFIFNTVPAKVLDESILEKVKSSVIIELASAPYGLDFTTAENLGIKVIKAGGLPGKMFPETAGKILYEVISEVI